MLSLQRGGFTAEAVALALHSPHGDRKVAFRYQLLDRNLNFKRELSTVTGGSVSMQALADIKRTAKFSLVDDGSIDFTADRIKPYMLLYVPPFVQAPGGWVEFALGVFLLSSPKRKEDDSGTITREVEAYDQTVLLRNYRVKGKYLIPAGTKFTDALRAALTAAGITRINIAPSTLVTPADREWEGGTTMLEIVNDLLKAMNYYSVWFDEEGVAVGSPYVLPEHAPSEYTYKDDGRSVILRGVEQDQDLWDIPNEWVFYTSEANGASLRSVRVNNLPGSRLSTVNRGMTITEYKQVEAADQATLDALTDRAFRESLEVYESLKWESWPMPFHSHFDSYTFVHGGMGINGKFRETSWSMDLKADGVMSHECRRQVVVA